MAKTKADHSKFRPVGKACQLSDSYLNYLDKEHKVSEAKAREAVSYIGLNGISSTDTWKKARQGVQDALTNGLIKRSAELEKVNVDKEWLNALVAGILQSLDDSVNTDSVSNDAWEAVMLKRKAIPGKPDAETLKKFKREKGSTKKAPAAEAITGF